MRARRPLVAAAIALSVALASSFARADCALPRSYVPIVTGNEVTICATDPDSTHAAGCPAAGGMLRVDVSNGAVTKIPDECVDAGQYTTTPTPCYVDECVPPGAYQYGYGTPYQCGSGCNTAYFVQVSVTQPLGSCTSDAGTGTVMASAPWDASVPRAGTGSAYGLNPGCSYSVEDAGAGGTDADASGDAPSGNDGAATGADGSSATDQGSGGGGGSGGGCTLATPPGAESTVLAIDGLALAIGLTGLARRRAKR